MSEETQETESTWSGLKKTIIGTLSTAVLAGGTWVTTTLFNGGEDKEETKTDIDPKRKLKHNVKMSLMISEELADKFIKQVGQRNKQDIIRGLIDEWIKKDKRIK